jgi:hypothetical protein
MIGAAAGCAGKDTGSVPICGPGQFSQCRCADGVSDPATGCVPISATAGQAGSNLATGASGTTGGVAGQSVVTGGSAAGTGTDRSGGGGMAGTTTGTAGATAGNGGAAAGSSGGAGASGAGHAGNGGASGTTGSAGSGSASDVCSGGKVGTDSSGLRAGSEYGAVKYLLPASNEIVDFKTVLAVPKTPTMMGTLFIWPGLQSNGGKDPARLGNGILQPVLTWGHSCAPGAPMNFSSWWVSGMYVNVSTAAAGPSGCAGGDAMNVAIGDALDMEFALTGTSWKQTVLDEQTMKTVDFSIDLKGQTQTWATLAIEIPRGSSVYPVEDVVFTNTVLTFKAPVTSCQPNQRGPNDYFSAPRASSDGLHCCIAKVTLRSQGVPATTMP